MIFEDELSEDMTDEEYDQWFSQSWITPSIIIDGQIIGGVRVGPDWQKTEQDLGER